MAASFIRFATLLFIVIAGSACAGGDAKRTEPTATETADIATPTNRQDCGQIRGTDYLSMKEREWFLSNCVEREPESAIDYAGRQCSVVCEDPTLELLLLETGRESADYVEIVWRWSGGIMQLPTYQGILRRIGSAWEWAVPPLRLSELACGFAAEVKVEDYFPPAATSLGSTIAPQWTPPAGSVLISRSRPNDANLDEQWAQHGYVGPPGTSSTTWSETWRLSDDYAGDPTALVRQTLPGDWALRRTAGNDDSGRVQLTLSSTDLQARARRDSATGVSIGIGYCPQLLTLGMEELWIRDLELYEQYQEVEAIAHDPGLSSSQKEYEIRDLGLGYESLTTLMRYLPVWEQEERRFTTLDSFARELGTDLGDDSPFSRDPVRGAIAILSDPSPATISSVLGLDDFR